MKHIQAQRSDCPINFSLEMIGDSWSLLIIRDIIYFGKKTYGEFLASDEGIARNILADRLERLQHKGIITKRPYDADRRKDTYGLTDAGLELIPILLDMAEWGAARGEVTAPKDWLDLVRERRQEVIAMTTETVRAGGSIFVGENSVIDSLHARVKTSVKNNRSIHGSR